MMYDEIITRATRLQMFYPDLRYGQAVFNVAYKQYPEIVEKYAGSRVDPFHNDAMVDTFLEVIEMQVGSQS
jgi:hypothetical protein